MFCHKCEIGKEEYKKYSENYKKLSIFGNINTKKGRILNNMLCNDCFNEEKKWWSWINEDWKKKRDCRNFWNFQRRF